MADLPRYQQTGRVFADVPQLDFANVRESFKASQSMSSALDKLSDFAGKYAEKKVEEDAVKWAVENPYTLEQAQAANEAGLTMDDVVKSSGGGVVWQNTIRKIQGEQLRIELEGLSKVQLAGLQKQIDLRQITDPSEIADKINSIGTGLFAPLKTLNPESYVKGKNAFGLHASSLYNDAVKKSVEQAKETALFNAEANLSSQTELDKLAIDAASSYQSLLATKELGAQRVFESFAQADVKIARVQADKYRTGFDNLIVNSFVKYTSTGDKAKDFAVINRMVEGDFGDEKMNAKYASLDYELQDKIRKAALDRRNDNFNAAKQQEQADQFENRVKIRQDKEKLLAGDLPYNEAISLATSMHSKGYIDDSLFKTITNPSEGDGNAELLGKVQYNIAMGVYKTPYDVPDSDYAMLNKQQRKSVWSFSANKQLQENIKGVNAAVSDITGGKIDSGKYATITKISEIAQRKTTEALNAGKSVDMAKINQEAIIEVQSDIKVQSLISEQKSAYDRILRISAVAKNSDKFDIRNVESFINIYGSELDDEDKKTLRQQALKFNGYINNTLKSWKDFSSNASK